MDVELRRVEDAIKKLVGVGYIISVTVAASLLSFEPSDGRSPPVRNVTWMWSAAITPGLSGSRTDTWDRPTADELLAAVEREAAKTITQGG